MSLCKICQEALPDFPFSAGVGNAPIIRNGLSAKPCTWEKTKKPKQPSQTQWLMKGRFSLHSSWETFVTSLEADCPLCWTCWRAIRSSPIASPSDEKIADFQAMITYGHFDVEDDLFNLWVCLEGTGMKAARLRLNITKTTREVYEENKIYIPAQHTAQSAAEAANRWIGVCDKNHPSCMARAAPPPDARMPTRLLDLGTGDSTTWRIIETQQDRVPYVALSHRWTENTPTLLQKNYDAYCDPQPDSILPQNYRDMLDICRAIQIRYIWIDSLCIIQDDNGADFRHEAPIMLDVYRYAFLTLMILWEFSDSTVFRECRPSTIARPRPQSYKRTELTETDQGSWYTCLKNLVISEAAVPSKDSMSNAHNYAFVRVENTGSYNFDVNNAPINKRAWVLQERSLSRRILCLGNEQLYWECDGQITAPLIANEASPNGLPSITQRESLCSLSGTHSVRSWNSLLEEYTARQLTYEEDRLVALSGVARAVAKLTGHTYFAGIWAESWMLDLLWEPDRARPESARAKPITMGVSSMVLPSWSWLSFPGSVIPGPHRCGFGLRLDSKEVIALSFLSRTMITPPDADPYVYFHQATIRIRGLLIPVEFAGINDTGKPPVFFRLRDDIEFASVGLDCLRLIPWEDHEKEYAPFEFQFSKPIKPSLKHFLVPLFLERDDPKQPLRSNPEDTQGRGLVVQESSNNGKRVFIRVGTWREDYRMALAL
ncbi:hypothetical protein FOXG_13073 [Fusarium oxysporum f. sp. lycopersici 4287]|uniref:Heterokaryon incompatibility domain-containing protein n=1 Tax=Fusarium oxysporum f. sp. lycopersici (strain 4287 / CBS 123668 / FGSC 9935 / NRRL 34936) TaxID=426428 RepID=A0A0J9VT28_FUSO4|nr:hypothetical protein FOXG_13073 [Fusarium oxysporum f. sp. lycopersici 4287]KNB14149.1 hypothetical protein FOXG_13073 [Fusarium oxysporum f. sp. lycopersici 4287]